MDCQAILEAIQRHQRYQGQIVHIQHLESREAAYADLSGPLHPLLQDSLSRGGIDRLYSHQAGAIEAVRRGEHVVVVTPAASGKTMCFNLPVLDACLRDPDARALYLFPTKSLSQDQAGALAGFNVPVEAGLYDGDTPDMAKARIRETSRIVVTNPDMVHLGILPNHLKWHQFFRHLRYVIIDEVHTYRGVFGTHLAHVLRRLRRICRYYGADPLFITCSATIANPKAHAERLTGLPMSIIDHNGAPRGAGKFVLWRPPSKRPYIWDVVWLLALLLNRGRRTIAFTKARQTTERVLRYARQELAGTPLERVMFAYRGGYLAQERRQIEQALFTGRALGVVSTNALELGIDVGELEACIIAGYPGTIASTWQQAGRVGRRQKESLVIFMAVENPLDQYFLRHTGCLFSRPSEHALIDPRNPYILLGHALCAAHELPVTSRDFSLWDEVFQGLLTILEEDGQVTGGDGAYYYLGQAYPAEGVNVRTSASNTCYLRDRSNGNRLVGMIDGHRAFSEAYPGAVYLHQGETYLVEDLDAGHGTAYVKKTEVDYYTVTKRHKETEILGITEQKELHGHQVCLGSLRVRTKVNGYVRKHELTGQVLGGGDLNLPEQVLETVGLWITLGHEAEHLPKRYGLDLMGGLHAIEHASIGMLPLLAMCDRNDIGGLSVVAHAYTRRPTIFIHDAYEGGVGFSEKAFQDIQELLKITLEAIAECECEDGCPGCIHSPKCSNFNRPLDKEAAILLLHALLGREYVPKEKPRPASPGVIRAGKMSLNSRLQKLEAGKRGDRNEPVSAPE